MSPGTEPIFAGLDIGGTKLLVGVADEHGRLLRHIRRPTPAGLQEGLDSLCSMLDDLRQERPIKGIGAAVGGPLDHLSGVVSPLHQPAWRKVPLKDYFETRYSCPFRVDVDTNVAALGEYEGSRVRPDRFLYLTLSTGMGGGFMLDGRLYRGARGTHPEVAHQSIHFRCRFPERITCECGLPDCLEALISGNGIRRLYGKPAEALEDHEWAEVAWNLGQGLRNLAVIYAPDLIVLGGGVALGGGQALIDRARNVMRDYLHIVPPPQVRLTNLGTKTTLLGALVLARQAD